MKKLFGTDGMRGRAGVFPLDPDTVHTVGSSLARQLQKQLERPPSIVIGRDTRESGDWLETSLRQGAETAGARCESAGVITTPGVAYLTRKLSADAGIVISASHNPYQDNGIKIFAPTGKKIDSDTERQIETDIYASSQGHHDNGEASPAIDNERASGLQNLYLDFLTDEIAGDLDLNGLKLVIDCANGAASDLAPRLFDRLGAQVVAINNQPNGRNINEGCGSLHTDQLTKAVVAEKANLGVAFDGDADRSLFADEKGNFVDGDATLWVLANYLRKREALANSVVVATVMSNLGLEIALRRRGIGLTRTDVGDKYVLDELLRSGASLGGEQSGHVILPRLSLAGDGMITTICLLHAMQGQAQPLGALTAGLEHYPQILINVPVREKVPFADVPSLRKLVEQTEARMGENGRLLLRYSGTEPLARVMIEGIDQSQVEADARAIADSIRQTLGEN